MSRACGMLTGIRVTGILVVFYLFSFCIYIINSSLTFSQTIIFALLSCLFVGRVVLWRIHRSDTNPSTRPTTRRGLCTCGSGRARPRSHGRAFQVCDMFLGWI
jgi:hypothetical protein